MKRARRAATLSLLAYGVLPRHTADFLAIWRDGLIYGGHPGMRWRCLGAA